MSLRAGLFNETKCSEIPSKLQGLCDACFHFDAKLILCGVMVVLWLQRGQRRDVSCAFIAVERQVNGLPHDFAVMKELEERVRGASGALHRRAGHVRGRHGVPW